MKLLLYLIGIKPLITRIGIPFVFVYVLLLSFLPFSYLKIIYWITMIGAGVLLVYKIKKDKNRTVNEKIIVVAISLLIFGYFLYIMTKFYLTFVNI